MGDRGGWASGQVCIPPSWVTHPPRETPHSIPETDGRLTGGSVRQSGGRSRHSQVPPSHALGTPLPDWTLGLPRQTLGALCISQSPASSRLGTPSSESWPEPSAGTLGPTAAQQRLLRPSLPCLTWAWGRSNQSHGMARGSKRKCQCPGAREEPGTPGQGLGRAGPVPEA